MLIDLIRADITSVKVDAIVNATNPQLHHVAGLGPILLREGSRIVQKESSELAPMPVGSAVVTSGGNLLCQFIIHAVAPQMGEGNEDAKLRKATLSSLARAEELAIRSVAFPAIGAGPFGFTLERCARVMLGATIDFRLQARSLQSVVYCLFGEEPHREFARVLGELQP